MSYYLSVLLAGVARLPHLVHPRVPLDYRVATEQVYSALSKRSSPGRRGAYRGPLVPKVGAAGHRTSASAAPTTQACEAENGHRYKDGNHLNEQPHLDRCRPVHNPHPTIWNLGSFYSGFGPTHRIGRAA